MSEPTTETKPPELVVPKCVLKRVMMTSDCVPGMLWSYSHVSHTMRDVIAKGYFDPLRDELRNGGIEGLPRGVGAKIDCYLGDPRKGSTYVRLEAIDVPASEHEGPVCVAKGPWKKFSPSPYDDDELTGRKPTTEAAAEKVA